MIVPPPAPNGEPAPDLPLTEAQTVRHATPRSDETRDAAKGSTNYDKSIPHLSGTTVGATSRVEELSVALQDAFDLGRPIATGYTLVRQLGRGTFGTVWLAVETGTEHHVAVKFFAHGTADQLRRLADEAAQLARLDGLPGIVSLKAFDFESEPPFIVMGYAPGGSLKDRLDQHGRLTVEQVVPLFESIAGALAGVHAKGIIHCDLKPGNVLLREVHDPVLADFGQAHLQSDGLQPALGTFFYMPPEQSTIEPTVPDAAWDVYALGAMIYALLTGNPPHHDETLRKEIQDTLELGHRLDRYRSGLLQSRKPDAHHDLPGMDRSLRTILDRCLAIDPARRFKTAGEVKAALTTRRIQNARRPWLWGGLLAPIAFVLAVLALAAANAPAVMEKTRRSLEEQICSSDRSAASLIADVVGEKVRDRVGAVEYLADRAGESETAEKMVKLSKEQAAFPPSQYSNPNFMKGPRHELANWLNDKCKARGCLKDLKYGVTLIDDRGYKLAEIDDKGVHVADAELLGLFEKDWSYRNWYNGVGTDDQPAGGQYKPVDHVHLSRPYYSTRSDLQMAINVAAPVHLEGQVIGLVVARIKCDELTGWLEGVRIDHGYKAVFDQLGRALEHVNKGAYRLDDLKQVSKEYPLDPQVLSAIAGRRMQPGSLTDYADPIEVEMFGQSAPYLAGYKLFEPAEGLTWVAVVQHRRDEVMQPINDLRNHLVVSGLVILAVAGALYLLVVFVLVRMLNRAA